MLRKKLAKTSGEVIEQPLQRKKRKVSNNSQNSVESKYFSTKLEIVSEMSNTVVSKQLILITKELTTVLKQFTFPKPIQYCYNPTEYALEPYKTYINLYCTNPKDIIFVGMNPGPFGMCQTGVPFGEVTHVRDWMKINQDVGKPEIECPARPIQGFFCTKTEQSGLKLWGLFKSLCETPEQFFKHTFVYNYCPLAFMDDKGRNITPNAIKVQC